MEQNQDFNGKENFQTKKEKIKNKKILSIISIITAFILTFFGGYFSHYLFDSKNVSVARDVIRIMQNVAYIVDPETGEPVDIDYEDIADSIVSGLNDKYAVYYTKEEYQKIKSMDRGERVDFGFGFYSEGLTIDKVNGNSPAFKSGIRQGDTILGGKKIDGDYFAFSNYLEFSQFMSTVYLGDEIVLKIQRESEQKEFSLTAEKYSIAYVSYYDNQTAIYFEGEFEERLTPKAVENEKNPLLSPDTALISLSAFEGDAFSQLKTALEVMSERGRSKLILDLRNNGGGSMDVLEDVASLLIYNGGKDKTLIAYSEGKKSNESFYFNKNNYFSNVNKISVIANQNTASASECLIGAMIHYGQHFSLNNLVVTKNDGEEAKTFGKGIMQTTYLLLSGGALKLTTARILWPDKTTCIHGKGIVPTTENGVSDGNAVLRAQQILNSEN